MLVVFPILIPEILSSGRKRKGDALIGYQVVGFFSSAVRCSSGEETGEFWLKGDGKRAWVFTPSCVM